MDATELGLELREKTDEYRAALLNALATCALGLLMSGSELARLGESVTTLESERTTKLTILDETGHSEAILDTPTLYQAMAAALLSGRAVFAWPRGREEAMPVHSQQDVRGLDLERVLVVHPIAGG